MSNSGYPLVEIAKITDMTEEKVKEILIDSGFEELVTDNSEK